MNVDLHRAHMLRQLDDELMRQANSSGFITVTERTWKVFYKLAVVRDAVR